MEVTWPVLVLGMPRGIILSSDGAITDASALSSLTQHITTQNGPALEKSCLVHPYKFTFCLAPATPPDQNKTKL